MKWYGSRCLPESIDSSHSEEFLADLRLAESDLALDISLAFYRVEFKRLVSAKYKADLTFFAVEITVFHT